MLHRDTGENLSALDPRDTQGLFIISTWSSHLWLSLESIKLPHFPGTWHRHLCLYEMQRTQSRVLQIGPCCSSSEMQDFNFYHIFFTTSLPFLICLHSWGTPEGTRMLHTCKPSLSFSPANPLFKVPALAGETFLCNTGKKTKRERQVLQAFLWSGVESQEEEQPEHSRKIRGESEKNSKCGTWLLQAPHSANLLSGKRSVLHSLCFYFPSQGTLHGWRRKRKITVLDIISVL